MKHIKLFENKIMDDILDKISSTGKKSLTDWEKEYLLSIDTPRQIEMEENIEKGEEQPKKEKEYKSLGKYDPRKDDTDFYKELGDDIGIGDDMDNYFKNMDDEEYKLHQLEIFWDKIDDEDINEFFDSFHIYGDFATTTWDKLPSDVKSKFQMYLIQKGYINK